MSQVGSIPNHPGRRSTHMKVNRETVNAESAAITAQRELRRGQDIRNKVSGQGGFVHRDSAPQMLFLFTKINTCQLHHHTQLSFTFNVMVDFLRSSWDIYFRECPRRVKVLEQLG